MNDNKLDDFIKHLRELTSQQRLELLRQLGFLVCFKCGALRKHGDCGVCGS